MSVLVVWKSVLSVVLKHDREPTLVTLHVHERRLYLKHTLRNYYAKSFPYYSSIILVFLGVPIILKIMLA